MVRLNGETPKNTPLIEDTYTPGGFYLREAREMSGERLKTWIRLCNSRILFNNETPPVGAAYVIIDPRGKNTRGYDSNGKRISLYQAEKTINEEMLAKMFEIYGNDVYKQEVEEEGVKPLIIPEVDTKGKNLDQIKEEMHKAEQAKKEAKRANRIR